MPLPTELARHLTEEKIAFVQRSGLRAEVLEPGYVRLRMPGAGNENHIGSMYAGALFTLAEIPGGALFLTSFDSARFYPIVKEMTLRFRRPAKGDIRVEARLDAERIRQLETEAGERGKAEYSLELQLTDEQGKWWRKAPRCTSYAATRGPDWQISQGPAKVFLPWIKVRSELRRDSGEASVAIPRSPP